MGKDWLHQSLQEDPILYTLLGGSQDSQGSPGFWLLPAVETAKQSCLPTCSTLGGVRNCSSGPAPYLLRQDTWGSLCRVFTTVQPVCSRVCTAGMCILFIFCSHKFRGTVPISLIVGYTPSFNIESHHVIQDALELCLRLGLAQTPNLPASAS